jgi:hypothetical protein
MAKHPVDLDIAEAQLTAPRFDKTLRETEHEPRNLGNLPAPVTWVFSPTQAEIASSLRPLAANVHLSLLLKSGIFIIG